MRALHVPAPLRANACFAPGAASFAWQNAHPSLSMRGHLRRRRSQAKLSEYEMSDTTTTNPAIRNGVNTDTLFATLDAIKSDPELAKFQFRANNRWIFGTHSQSTIDSFFGARQDMHHASAHTADADHPAILVGEDHGPTPVEFLLHALA